MLKTDKPTSLLQHKMLAGDRSGSKAGLTASERDFWSTPNNGHQQVGTVGPFRAKTGSDEPYSITSSARARSDGGTSIPSDFAVLRLMVSKNLVGCSIGRSAGLAPLRIRSI